MSDSGSRVFATFLGISSCTEFCFLPVSPLMVVQVFHSQMAIVWPDQ